MAILFQDGFEPPNGINQWTVIRDGVALAPTLNTDINYAKAGIQSARFYCGPQGTPTFIVATSALQRIGVNSRDIYVRGWFYLAQGLADMGQYDRISLIRLLTSTGSGLLTVQPRHEAAGSPLRWALWCATDNVGAGTHHYGITASVDTTPRWICVEVHFNADSGLFECWIDGVLERTWTNPLPTGGFNAVDRVIIGLQRPAYNASFPPYAQYTSDIYVDEIAYGDAYIGPGEIPTPPKLNISSNPELNVPVYVDDGLGGPLVFIGNTPITGYTVVAGRTYRVQVEPEVTR